MKEILRHIVWMTILVSWALLSASCRGGEVSYTDEVQPDDDTAILVLRTGLLDQTRVSDRVNDAVDIRGEKRSVSICGRSENE